VAFYMTDGRMSHPEAAILCLLAGAISKPYAVAFFLRKATRLTMNKLAQGGLLRAEQGERASCRR